MNPSEEDSVTWPIDTFRMENKKNCSGSGGKRIFSGRQR